MWKPTRMEREMTNDSCHFTGPRLGDPERDVAAKVGRKDD